MFRKKRCSLLFVLAFGIFVVAMVPIKGMQNEEENIPLGTSPLRLHLHDSEEFLDQFAPTYEVEGTPSDSNGPLISSTDDINLSSHEQSVINDVANPLSSYFLKIVLQDAKSLSPPQSRAFYAAQIIGSIFGLTAGIPWISSALKAGEAVDSSLYGYVIAGAAIFASGLTTSWAILEVLERFKKKSDEEYRVLNQTNNCKRIGRYLICNALAFFASAPTFYLTYKYNTFKPLAVYAFLLDFGFRSLGYYQMSEIDFSRLKKAIKNRSLANVRSDDEIVILLNSGHNKVMQFIEATQITFLKMAPEERYRNFEILKNAGDNKQAHQFLTELIRENFRRTPPPELWKRGIPRNSLLLVSTVFPIANAIVNTVLTYKAAQIIYDNRAFACSIVALSVPPSFALGTYVMHTVWGESFDSIYNIYTNYNRINLLSSFYPLTKYIIPVLTLTFIILSIGGDIFLTQDTLNDSVLSGGKWLLTSLVVLSIAQLEALAITDTFNNLGTSLLAKTGEAKNLINFIQWLGIFSSLFSSADDDTKSEFLGELEL